MLSFALEPPLLQNIVTGLKETTAAAALPIAHFCLDLWTCEVPRKKYLGIHIFWVDDTFKVQHALLAVGAVNG